MFPFVSATSVDSVENVLASAVSLLQLLMSRVSTRRKVIAVPSTLWRERAPYSSNKLKVATRTFFQRVNEVDHGRQTEASSANGTYCREKRGEECDIEEKDM